MKVKGVFRKNNPLTKQMVLPGEYIHAVGLIKKFNGLSYYEKQLFDKYATINRTSSLREQIEKALASFETVRLEYQNEIPQKYKDNTDLKIYKVETLTNPLATHQCQRTYSMAGGTKPPK